MRKGRILIVLLVAILVTSCGRQVTPPPVVDPPKVIGMNTQGQITTPVPANWEYTFHAKLPTNEYLVVFFEVGEGERSWETRGKVWKLYMGDRENMRLQEITQAFSLLNGELTLELKGGHTLYFAPSREYNPTKPNSYDGEPFDLLERNVNWRGWR